jgi:hypothetical protein
VVVVKETDTISLLINSISMDTMSGSVLSLHQRLKSREHLLKELYFEVSQKLQEARISYFKAPIATKEDQIHLHDEKQDLKRKFDKIGKVSTEIYRQKVIVHGYLTRLDTNSLIDHRQKWHKEAWRYLREHTEISLREMCECPILPGQKDQWTEFLAKMQRAGRKSEYIARLENELALRHGQGWYIVFDTLTVSEEKRLKFEKDDNALRDHFRQIGRLVNKVEGKKAKDSYEEVFKYFCVPEFGSKNGRLHFHAIYLMKHLPKGCVDPNLYLKTPYRREINKLKFWQYGWNTPIAVRYFGDRFTRDGWAWPVKRATGQAIEAKPLIAVCLYVSGYVNKNSNGDQECQNKTERRRFRVRMSRKFGASLPTLAKVSPQTLVQLSRLHFSVSRKARLIRRHAKREMRSRLAGTNIKQFMALRQKTMPLLERLRSLTAENQNPKLLSSIPTETPALRRMDISEEAAAYVDSIPIAWGKIGGTGK